MKENLLWAKIVSTLFHPLIMPTLALAILFSIPSYITMSISAQARFLITSLVFINTCIAPVLIIFLMKKTGLIYDVTLRVREERIYPTLVSILFYLFTYYLFSQADLPSILIYFITGSTFVVVMGFTVSIYWKISFHMLSMGGFTGFLIALAFFLTRELHLLIAASIFVSGLVASARLRLGVHTSTQVYAGFFTGALVMISMFFWLKG